MVNSTSTVNDAGLLRLGLERLEAVLSEVPFVKDVKIKREPSDKAWDADILVRTDAGRFHLLVECKRQSEPRFLREATAQFELARVKDPDAYPVVVGPYISPESAEICREHGVGYLDLAGNCLLSFGQVYIHREGVENPLQDKRPLVSLFSPRAERVLRALFDPDHWGRTWTFRDLAAHVQPGVSLGLVHKVVQALRDNEYVTKLDDGIRLRKPEPLLLEWARNYRFRRNKARRFFSLLRAGELEAKLAELIHRADTTPQTSAAFASFSAASRIAPYIRQNRFWLYFQGDLSSAIKDFDLKEVPSGENVIILEPYDEGVFYYGQTFDDGSAATGAIQTYLDVNASGGQGREAAERILETVLRKRWASHE